MNFHQFWKYKYLYDPVRGKRGTHMGSDKFHIYGTREMHTKLQLACVKGERTWIPKRRSENTVQKNL